jgi:hypothetical protein
MKIPKPKDKNKSDLLKETPDTAPWEQTVQGGSGLMTAPVPEPSNPASQEAEEEGQPDKEDVIKAADQESK